MRTGSKPPATTACAASPPPYSFRPLFREGTRDAGGVRRAGRDGLPHGRAPGQRPRDGGLQPHPREGAGLAGAPRRRRRRGPPRRPKWPRSCSPASATTTTCARSRWATRRLPAMADGRRLVDHTTTSAEVARELQAAAEATGGGFVDAPVSGGQAGAENGQLTVMCGGDAAAFARAEPVMRAYAKAVDADGPAGRGPAHQDGQPDLHRRRRPGARRGHAFRQAAGLDIRAGLSTRSPRARPSPGRWTTAGRPWPRASSTSASPSTGCARTSASASTRRARNGASLPVTALVDRFYAEVQAMGGSRWDTSSLIVNLRERQG